MTDAKIQLEHCCQISPSNVNANLIKVSSAISNETCEVGSHGSQQMIMIHLHLGISPHNVSNRLTAPCVQMLSHKVTSHLHICKG